MCWRIVASGQRGMQMFPLPLYGYYMALYFIPPKTCFFSLKSKNEYMESVVYVPVANPIFPPLHPLLIKVGEDCDFSFRSHFPDPALLTQKIRGEEVEVLLGEGN